MNERIKELRKALGMTQAEFGKSLKVSENYVWMLENGKRNLSDRSMEDLVRKHNVNEEWLRTGNGDMFLEKTYEDEVARFCGEVLHGDINDPRFEFLRILAGLPMEDWKLVGDFMDAIRKEQK